MLQMEDYNGNISMVAKANNSIGTFTCIPDGLSLQGLANEKKKKTTRFSEREEKEDYKVCSTLFMYC